MQIFAYFTSPHLSPEVTLFLRGTKNFIIVDSHYFMNHKKLLNVALELAREVWECKELPNYFTLGPGKVFIGCMQTAKSFEKIQGIRHLVLAEYGLH